MTIAVTPPIAGQQAPRREVVRRAQPSIVALAWSRCSRDEAQMMQAVKK